MDTTENLNTWERQWDWSNLGEEWSAPFGGSSWQWYWCVRPRLMSLLPCQSMVEIAPGFGRWTRFLVDECTQYIGVDLAEKCVAGCAERFADRSHCKFIKGDGDNLPGVADNSVDLVFSFDSLVHVEAAQMERYIAEIARVLKPSGHAFLHYSNMLDSGAIDDSEHLRAPTMGSSLMRQFALENDLFVATEEIVPSGELFIDAISLLVKDHPGDRGTRSFKNAQFPHVTTYIHKMSKLWQE